MTTQDPELSAALGWPGGISNPVLDRTRLLQMVAALRLASQQALEALEGWENHDRWVWPESALEQAKRNTTESLAALRAALAQQAEPAQDQRCRAEPRSDGDFVCDCKIGDCLGRSAEPAQQAEPLNLSDPAIQKRLATQWGYVPAAAQAEPVEQVAWVASKDGRVIYDDASTDDGLLRVSGDFENDEQRVRYAQRIVDKLNAALAQRTMVPLTEEEIDKIFKHLCNTVGASYKTMARAVEKASWEKNHGKA